MSGDGVVVIGAGGHGTVVTSTLLAAGIAVAGIVDDAPATHGTVILGVRVLGPVSLLRDRAGARAVAAIGDNAVRKRVVESLPRVAWVSAIHPAAVIAPEVSIAPGAMVFAGAVLQPRAAIGSHAVVNTGATVDHDCRLAPFAHAGPGAHLSGSTVLDEGAFLGTGSSTYQGVRIGAWTTVGVGAAVVRDLPAGVIAVGVPARVTRVVAEAARG
jgi:sugar O-acyltransferase (sialic acid O-acetyltransferase NeuD family)